MAFGLDLTALDRDQLAEPLLLAALTHHYAQLERRLEVAANLRDPHVRDRIATAALELFLRSCDPELAARLEPRRGELVAAIVAHRAAISDTVFDLARHLDRPRFAGPINLIFRPLRRLNAVVVAPAGPVLEYAEKIRDQFVPEARLAEASTSERDLDGRNLLLYGPPDAPLIKSLLARAGWEVAATHISLGGRRIEGEQLALIACRARDADPSLVEVLYTAFDERVVLGINALHHGPSDYVIGRLTRAGRYQIVLRGNFARGPNGELLTSLPA